jgi:hypothetical protein
MSNVGTTQLTWQTEGKCKVGRLHRKLGSCLCSRPPLHFPSVCYVNCVVPTLDMAYPSPSCLCSRPTLHFPSDC